MPGWYKCDKCSRIFANGQGLAAHHRFTHTKREQPIGPVGPLGRGYPHLLPDERFKRRNIPPFVQLDNLYYSSKPSCVVRMQAERRLPGQRGGMAHVSGFNSGGAGSSGFGEKFPQTSKKTASIRLY